MTTETTAPSSGGDNPWISTVEAARILGVTSGHLRQLIRAGAFGRPSPTSRRVRKFGETTHSIYQLNADEVRRYAATNRGGGRGRPRIGVKEAAKRRDSV